MKVIDRMRAEWNRRAKKDAHFYVAFGRQRQSEEDFLASAAETMPAFEREFSRLPPTPAAERRALEIGCGPGRLMLPMSQHFGEIHGVDVSDQMARLARERLRDVPHAHVQTTSGEDLSVFPESYFDFVYSYTVFQHIPSRDIVLNYMREARRVLKPGGILCCQLRGIPPLASEMGRDSDTWTGCWLSEEDVAQFSREQRFPLVAISGIGTQYLWTTFRRPVAAAVVYAQREITLKAVTATTGPDAIVPARGRDAAVSLWMDGMPEGTSLAECKVSFGGRSHVEHKVLGCYLSPVSESGGCQMDARLPNDISPGEYSVALGVQDHAVANAQRLTVLPAPPHNPRVLTVTDGINLTSRYRVETGGLKVVIEDLASPEDIRFTIAGLPVRLQQYECKDPITATYEFAFYLADRTPAGRQPLVVGIGSRQLEPIIVEVL